MQSLRTASDEKKNVLFLRGLRDDGTVRIVRIVSNNHPIYNCEGSCNVYAHVESECFRKHLITLDANREQDIRLPETDLIFNQISESDTHRIALTKAGRLCDALKENVPCINHPARITTLTRDRLHEMLADIDGVRPPATMRLTPASPDALRQHIEETGWGYPVILRRCGDHNGANMIRITQPDETDGISHTFFRNECYLIRFVDYAGADGIYRKHRLACIDGEFHVRHVLYNDHWMVHAGTREKFMKQNPRYIDLERGAIEHFNTEIKPALTNTARRIRDAVGLDYFGIDCSIDESMNMTLFELNPNMNILHNSAPLPNHWEPLIIDMKQALVHMIQRRLLRD